MTEYDYSPEAYEAYLATQAKISRWVNKTNRMYPHLGNPFTPATPAAHGSDLPGVKGKDGDRSPLRREREQDRDRGGNFNSQREKDGVSEKERKRDRHRDRDQEKYRERDRDRSRNQGNDHNSSGSHSDSRSRSHSRPAPPRSKSTPREPPRTPHSRRASYDQYQISKESKYHSSKHDLNSPGYSHQASKSKPDLHSSKSKYSSKYDSDIPSASSSRKHSSSSTHLPQNHLPSSRHRASASTHHLPTQTSPPPLTSHYRYPSNPNPSPAQRQPMRSQTMPPDRSGPSWLAPQSPPPVISQGGYYATQGQGYYYSPKGTGLQNERRVIPPPLPIRVPEPDHGHGHGHHTQGRGQKVESPKHQQPLLKRLLTNLTLGRQTGSPTSSHRRRRRSF